MALSARSGHLLNAAWHKKVPENIEKLPSDMSGLTSKTEVPA